MRLWLLLSLLSFNLMAQEDESEYLRALRLSCDKQHVGLGCYNYANAMLRAENTDLAEKYFALGCSYEHTLSCSKEKWDLPELAKKSEEAQVKTPTEITPQPEPVPDLATETSPEMNAEIENESTDLELEPATTINE